MRLILGSGSPRRRELLGQLGITPDEIRAADIDESPAKGELPRPYCSRMAVEKAEALPPGAGEIVLTADTTVALGRRILGKPEGRAEAAGFLRALSGRRHRVITALAVRSEAGMWQRDVVTSVRMKRLSQAEIFAYLETGDWQGKAGGYAIQGPAGAFIPWISGSYSAVMGLPVAETAQLLVAAGYPLYGETS
ncbi:septum formation protein Maf [Oceanicola sp. D3]|uniref:Maf family protein n=1 Tax=Oceanicola sp. D3 TaxID=2587163 RepID=UPI00111D3E05|nr:nucleoside triphosphate pyrophosphatase [Oceanicola sp. D3]QDC08728.1 septum formation protein Maf [Oceanicola sp. D3]